MNALKEKNVKIEQENASLIIDLNTIKEELDETKFGVENQSKKIDNLELKNSELEKEIYTLKAEAFGIELRSVVKRKHMRNKLMTSNSRLKTF
jgi:hypothetical protein